MKLSESNKRVKYTLMFISWAEFIFGKQKQNKIICWSYRSFILLIACIQIVGGFITIVNISNPLYKFEAAARMIFGVYSITIIPCFHRIFKKELEEVFSPLDENSPNYVGDDVMTITADKFYKNIQYYGSTYGAMILMGTIAETMAGENVDEIEIRDFLFLFSCGSNDGQPKIGFCVEKGSPVHFIVNVIINTFVINFIGAVSVIGWLLVLVVINYVEAMLQRCERIIFSGAEKMCSMKKSDSTDLIDLTSVIKNQQEVFKRTQLMISLLNVPNLGHVIIINSVCIFCMVAIAEQNFKSIYLILRWFTVLVYTIGIHYACCKNLGVIGSANESFANALLQFPWYERSMKFQKCYLTLLTMTQKNYPITVYGLYEMDLKFFVSTMNRLYSLINLLLLKYKL